MLSLWENFHAVVGAASGAGDLASQVSTEAQDGARSSNLVTDCLLGKEFLLERDRSAPNRLYSVRFAWASKAWSVCSSKNYFFFFFPLDFLLPAGLEAEDFFEDLLGFFAEDLLPFLDFLTWAGPAVLLLMPTLGFGLPV